MIFQSTRHSFNVHLTFFEIKVEYTLYLLKFDCSIKLIIYQKKKSYTTSVNFLHWPAKKKPEVAVTPVLKRISTFFNNSVRFGTVSIVLSKYLWHMNGSLARILPSWLELKLLMLHIDKRATKYNQYLLNSDRDESKKKT